MNTMLDMFEHRPGELWGSALPETREDLERIVDAGIKVMISLESRFGFPDFSGLELEQHHITVPDFGIPSDDNVREFVTIVEDALKQGKPVLIHCLAGCGRTGTMMALAEVYLYDSADGRAAIDRVRKSRPCAIETDGQEEVIVKHAEMPIADLRPT
ncbi:MAG: protein-tyrosine phosphatase family protein [Candidatus Thorarchaeota archaeon]|jgi:protein-tyrosine phosphatase